MITGDKNNIQTDACRKCQFVIFQTIHIPNIFWNFELKYDEQFTDNIHWIRILLAFECYQFTSNTLQNNNEVSSKFGNNKN